MVSLSKKSFLIKTVDQVELEKRLGEHKFHQIYESLPRGTTFACLKYHITEFI